MQAFRIIGMFSSFYFCGTDVMRFPLQIPFSPGSTCTRCLEVAHLVVQRCRVEPVWGLGAVRERDQIVKGPSLCSAFILATGLKSSGSVQECPVRTVHA